MPKVSVIVAAYNCEDTVADALNSILRQTYTEWECIVCDDGSQDSTWKVVNEIAKKKYEKFLLLRNDENKGAAYSRNRCIEAASGEYIAIQDADDVSYPERLKKQVSFLDTNPDVSVCGTYAEIYDGNGKTWGKVHPPLFPVPSHWARASCVVHASTIMRKKDVIDCGLYNTNMKRDEDYELFLRMIIKGYRIVTIPEVLYRYRMDLKDYAKRKFRHRLNEGILKFKAVRSLKISPLYYGYALKPILCGLIPSSMLYYYHRSKFGK